MKKITKNNKVFNSEAFLNDKYLFNIIFLNLDNPNLLMLSDEENYIICRGDKSLPTWIWTKDNITSEKLEEVVSILKEYIYDKNLRFTSKKKFYDYLKNKDYPYLDEYYFEMGVLTTKDLNYPKKCDGNLFKATLEDIEILSNHWYNSANEMVDTKSISLEKAKIEVLEMYNDHDLYCWKNKNNEIVSMLEYEIYYGQAKITHVYTPIHERNKGYAANIVYEISKKLLNQNIIPVLYTNYNYSPSNKAYFNIGYKNIGYLINFRCSKK